MRLMRDVCRRALAGVVVTHGAQLASWADRVVFLRDGRVVDQTRARRARVLAGRRPWPAVMNGRESARPVAAPSCAGRGACSGAEWRQQLLVLILVTVGVAAR